MDITKHNELLDTLREPAALAAYKQAYDAFPVGWPARFFGTLLIAIGDFVYGSEPSYRKFRALEVIARTPYLSWQLVGQMLLTLGYTDERQAIRIAQMRSFSQVSRDNETMHVIVLSQLAKKYGEDGVIRYALFPFVFSLFSIGASFLLYLVSPRTAIEFNYLFEDHAYRQYDRFLEREVERLRHSPLTSEFLVFSGRQAETEYALFISIRNDELIHRNESARLAG